VSEQDIKAVAALDDGLRRRMYTYIRAARRAVTRDEAAASVGISRKLAAFHLDKLVAAGLLTAHYERAGRVGRAPKVYQPTEVDIRVAIPQRQPDMLASILLDAVTAADARAETLQAAEAHGERLVEVAKGRLGAERALTLAEETLTRHGFEVRRASPTRLRLRTCPFHPFTAQAPGLVCDLNKAFLTGLVRGLHATMVEAALVPEPGECCVELRAVTPSSD
jgi:predicted ArsR family transcriptional regulator